jgi:hypothetical protein
MAKANRETVLRVVGEPVTRDEAAPGADTGKRGLGLPLPNGAGTGPVAEASCPRQPRQVYPAPPVCNPVAPNNAAWRVEWMRPCRKLPAVGTAVLGPEALSRLLSG